MKVSNYLYQELKLPADKRGLKIIFSIDVEF